MPRHCSPGKLLRCCVPQFLKSAKWVLWYCPPPQVTVRSDWVNTERDKVCDAQMLTKCQCFYTFVLLLVTWQCQQNPAFRMSSLGRSSGQRMSFTFPLKNSVLWAWWLSTQRPQVKLLGFIFQLTSKFLVNLACMHGGRFQEAQWKATAGKVKQLSTYLSFCQVQGTW